MISLAMVLLCIFSNVVICFAAEPANGGENLQDKNIELRIPLGECGYVTIEVPVELVGIIPEENIRDLVNSPDIKAGDRIIVCDYITCENQVEQSILNSARSGDIMYIYKNYKEYGPEYLSGDVKYLSLSKGMTYSYSQEKNIEFGTTFPGIKPFTTTGIAVTYSYKIATTVTFSGPGEDSPYTTRDFRLKVYSSDVSWTQERYLYSMLESTRSGTSIEVVNVIPYIHDYTVS